MDLELLKTVGAAGEVLSAGFASTAGLFTASAASAPGPTSQSKAPAR
jgi:hypothetical protein